MRLRQQSGRGSDREDQETSGNGFYYENLVTGERAAHHEDERMMAASVIKLFVMTEALCGSRGTLNPDRIIRMKRRTVCQGTAGHLRIFMTESADGSDLADADDYFQKEHTQATNVLIDLRESRRLTARSGGWGYRDKSVLQRKMYDTEKSKRGTRNHIP